MLPRVLTVSPRAFTRWATAAVAVDAAVVVTGAAVRLTGSGLGCPTWPNCTGDQLDAAGLGLKGAIEFGNRVAGVVAFAVLVVTAVLAHGLAERRTDLRRLSLGLVAGFFANGVIGGITVLTHLNPAVVSLHFLFNMGLLVAAVALQRRSAGTTRTASTAPAAGPLRPLALAAAAVAGFVLLAGTLATGTGPHGGDADAPRFHFAPLERVTALHADAAMLLTGLVAALALVARTAPLPGAAGPAARRRTTGLLVVVALQAALGFAQYLLDLPAALVLLHVAGATVLWLATLDLVAVLARPPLPRTPRTRRARAGAAATAPAAA